MRWFNSCRRKGHVWEPYGWSVMGFGPYRYHVICAKCNAVATVPHPDNDEEELDEEDGPNTD